MQDEDDIFRHEYSVTPSSFTKNTTRVVVGIIISVMVIVAIIPLFPELDEDYPEDEGEEMLLGDETEQGV